MRRVRVPSAPLRKLALLSGGRRSSPATILDGSPHPQVTSGTTQYIVIPYRWVLGAGACHKFSGGEPSPVPHSAYRERPERATAVRSSGTSRNGQHQQRYVVVPMPVAVFGHGIQNSFLQFSRRTRAVLLQKAKQARLPELLALRIVGFRHPIGE